MSVRFKFPMKILDSGKKRKEGYTLPRDVEGLQNSEYWKVILQNTSKDKNAT